MDDKNWWLLIDGTGEQQIMQALDIDEIYAKDDRYEMVVIKLFDETVEMLKKQA